jgi:hypothetical protein
MPAAQYNRVVQERGMLGGHPQDQYSLAGSSATRVATCGMMSMVDFL